MQLTGFSALSTFATPRIFKVKGAVKVHVYAGYTENKIRKNKKLVHLVKVNFFLIISFVIAWKNGCGRVMMRWDRGCWTELCRLHLTGPSGPGSQGNSFRGRGRGRGLCPFPHQEWCKEPSSHFSCPLRVNACREAGPVLDCDYHSYFGHQYC